LTICIVNFWFLAALASAARNYSPAMTYVAGYHKTLLMGVVHETRISGVEPV
jgi:hypothetical protein